MLALCSGACWALYIIFGKKAGSSLDKSCVALAMLVGSCAIFPVGLLSSGMDLFRPAVLPLALILGIFSSALPYGVEIIALKNLPSRTFSILMSLEPALAALSGFLFLDEQLSLAQWAALTAIISASIGSTLTIRKQ